MRIRKIILVAAVGLHLSLVAFNNFSDFGSNEQFVKGVLSMKDVFSGSRNVWRSIQLDWIQTFIYWVIISVETVAACLMWFGFSTMLSARHEDEVKFSKASQLAANGIILACVLWLTGFLTIAGEWFLMYQSEVWNAQATAFSLFVSYMMVLLYLEKNSS